MDRKLMFFDCETGGFSANKHDIVEVGCVVTDVTGLRVIEEYSAKVLPMLPVNPDAAAVNGYDPAVWAREAVAPAVAAAEISRLSEGCTLVAQVERFDWGFLRCLLGAEDKRWLGGAARLCLKTLANQQGHKVANLAALATYYGVDPGTPHRALDDARTCRLVYLHLTGRAGELRSAGASEQPEGRRLDDEVARAARPD